MPVSYDKKTRADAVKDGRQLATVEIGGMNFQGGVTPTEQQEVLDLFQKLQKRKLAEMAAPPTPAPVAATTNDPKP